MTDSDLIELYHERAAISEHLGKLPRHEAEAIAYRDWREVVGNSIQTPAEIVEIVTAARKARGEG